MEPFKEFLNEAVVRQLGQIYARVYTDFDESAFCDTILERLQDLEFKARAAFIGEVLGKHLPSDFDAFAEVILASLHPCEDAELDDTAEFGPKGVMGFAGWPITELVVVRGIDFPEKALALLKEVTKRFSAEFAVRPFLDLHTELSLKIFKNWTVDPNRHVRRLASEGARPRLPWGMQLKKFVRDPAPVLPLLDALKDDPSEYVRRSVANNLNDIAKDHPDLVADIAAEWLQDASKDRFRLVKHACRTLIKQGHKRTLDAFGYVALSEVECVIQIQTPTVEYGSALEFDVMFTTPPGEHKVMIDYAIHFMKANGTTAPKVFKWKDTVIRERQVSLPRKHVIKPITTRTYYPGTHQLEILVNGVSAGIKSFELEM